MKKSKFLKLVFALAVVLTLSACSMPVRSNDTAPPSRSSGEIYLYGEIHGVARILNKEFELWQGCYNDKNMRNLFVELPSYTAEFLNLWMQSDNDGILDKLYNDWNQTASHNPDVKEFYKKIKRACPKTVFHGIDVGHQYQTTGERYLAYLKGKNMETSEQYTLAKKTIEQGKYYYEHSDDAYRENKMAENFICEYENISGDNIMGIFGSAHTGLDAKDYMTGTVPSMANQLKQRYGNAVHSEDLSWIAKDIEPSRVDTIHVDGKEYKASYFGKEDLAGMKDYVSREYWRLENSYDDFKNKPKTGDVLPYDNYPMLVESGQVFVIDFTKTDGSVVRTFYRSDGGTWNGKPSTEEFTVK